MNKKFPVVTAVMVALVSAAWISMHWRPPNSTGKFEYTFRTHEDDDGGTYAAGEIYSIEDEKGFKIAKVLTVDEKAVHVRLYKNVFPQRPTQVDPKSLTLGKADDPDGFSIGHLPLSKSLFASWHPVLIMRTTVSEEELEGYREWKKAGGGVFN